MLDITGKNQYLLFNKYSSIDFNILGQEVATYWYSAVRQYDFRKEPDVLHVNVNAGKVLLNF